MTAHPELLLHLVDVPGLDATGLRLYSPVSGGEYVCIGFRPRVGAWYGVPVMTDERTAEDCQWVPLGVDVRVSLIDSATRDRVARWVAGVTKLRCESTAPRWYWSSHDECWWLDAPSQDSRGFDHLGRLTRSGERLLEGVPALGEVDQLDDTRLADGSLICDALALLHVARHLGQEVPRVAA